MNWWKFWTFYLAVITLVGSLLYADDNDKLKIIGVLFCVTFFYIICGYCMWVAYELTDYKIGPSYKEHRDE